LNCDCGPIAQTIVARYEAVEWEKGDPADSHRATGGSDRREGGIMSLAEKHCVPCRGGVPPLKDEKLRGMLAQLAGWQVVDEHHLSKTYLFSDFRTALDFVNRVGAVAEEQGHHPDLYLAWGKVEIRIWTHKIDGLTESDFILAAKIDLLHPN
jgi:4a-hydroxytetrahydrobiopterin dehydratase